MDDPAPESLAAKSPHSVSEGFTPSTRDRVRSWGRKRDKLNFPLSLLLQSRHPVPHDARDLSAVGLPGSESVEEGQYRFQHQESGPWEVLPCAPGRVLRQPPDGRVQEGTPGYHPTLTPPVHPLCPSGLPNPATS